MAHVLYAGSGAKQVHVGMYGSPCVHHAYTSMELLIIMQMRCVCKQADTCGHAIPKLNADSTPTVFCQLYTVFLCDGQLHQWVHVVLPFDRHSQLWRHMCTHPMMLCCCGYAYLVKPHIPCPDQEQEPQCCCRWVQGRQQGSRVGKSKHDDLCISMIVVARVESAWV